MLSKENAEIAKYLLAVRETQTFVRLLELHIKLGKSLFLICVSAINLKGRKSRCTPLKRPILREEEAGGLLPRMHLTFRNAVKHSLKLRCVLLQDDDLRCQFYDC